ncbi:MAG: acyl-CoA dehydrogenase family protein [Desulfomonilia bacterium]|nr:acyl-CoA dehydrogenase family protein [Desulfomonilia bacterium]
MNQSELAAHNEERKAFNDLARSFARKELLDHVHEHEYPYFRTVSGIVETAREAGLFSINLPLDWGGTGLRAPALAGIMKEISTVDAGMAAMLFTHAAALELIAVAADTAEDRCRTICQLVSEPDTIPLAYQSYTAPEEMELPDVSGESTCLMSGKLPLLALGGMARYAVSAGARQKDGEFSYYLIDLSGDGIPKSDSILTMGFQACQAVDVTLNNVPALLIGAEGNGQSYFRKMQSRMSLPASAISLGIMEGSFKEALAYSGQRWQGNRTIVEWSAVRMKLAEMAVQIDVARSCLSGISSAFDAASTEGTGSAVAAAIHISDMACMVASEGVQVLGGNGYMKDYGQEKRMRDARQARSLLGMNGLKKMNYIERIIEEADL